MGLKEIINNKIQSLEEKLQTIEGTISDKEFKDLSTQVEEAKKAGIALLDDGYVGDAIELIQNILKLEFDKLSDSSMRETSKEIKKKNYFDTLDYMKLAIEQGKIEKDIIESAYNYWNSIKNLFDELEISEIERRLAEVILEYNLAIIRKSGEINYNDAKNEEIYYLIRERLQDISRRNDIKVEEKILVNSWLGKIVDIRNGEIDNKTMEKLIEDTRLWKILSQMD